MARYQILETPGKRLVYPTIEGLEAGDHSELRTQDEAKIEVQRLRGIARQAGSKADFVIVPIKAEGSTNGSASGSSGASSVRLSEENRRRLAQFCGLIMYETGDQMTMGDAVARLVDHFERTHDFGKMLDGIVAHEISGDPDFDTDHALILDAARQIRVRRKARAEANA